ncbi:MAG: methyltransferase domain-containing protein [Bacteroidetes Order II. Incertae sedis bacterium]|nr:methyltransferase domain-containing protein [Bacteroidetes Order II. bacterium]
MSEIFHFVKAGFRNPLHVGALMPSSPALARAMVEGLEIKPGQTVLELGPGTGSLTQALNDRLPQATCYLGIERDPHFVTLLQKRFPHLRFVAGDAVNAVHISNEHAEGPIKYIISGLPFATLPAPVRAAILENLTHLLTPGSVFRTFQYLHASRIPQAMAFRQYMNDRYGHAKRSPVVLRNIPPAYTYTWHIPHS